MLIMFSHGFETHRNMIGQLENGFSEFRVFDIDYIIEFPGYRWPAPSPAGTENRIKDRGWRTSIWQGRNTERFLHVQRNRCRKPKTFQDPRNILA